MKRLKWNLGDLTPSYGIKSSLCAERLFAYYTELTSSSTDFEPTAQTILDFGYEMCKWDYYPSLIEMEVPFPIRRQLYEISSIIGDHIHASLNCKDYHFNIWDTTRVTSGLEAEDREQGFDPVDKAKLARALWRWYYSVFEPISSRFKVVGSEHFQLFK